MVIRWTRSLHTGLREGKESYHYFRDAGTNYILGWVGVLRASTGTTKNPGVIAQVPFEPDVSVATC